MHTRAVVALRIILEHQLPIGLHVVLNPFRRAQDRHIPMRKLPVQLREPFFQWHRVLIEIDEDESFPKREIHRAQGIISLIEPRHFIHVRRADQPTIEPVGPGVIRTLNRGRVAARVFLQARPTMPADVEESVNSSVLIPNNN